MYFDTTDMTFREDDTDPPSRWPLTNEEYIYLLTGRGQGNTITLDPVTGGPVLTPIEQTPEFIEAAQRAKLLSFSQLAANQKSALTNRIGVINDAIEFDEATPEEIAELPVRKTQLTAWKRYAVELGRVTSQPGWYAVVEWPIQPTEGMDLSTSPTANRPSV